LIAPTASQSVPAASLPSFLVFVFAVAFSGCATVTAPKVAQPPAPLWESAQLIESITQRRAQFRTLRSLARINYAGPEGKHGFDEAVLVQRPDRLRL
jgi:hypothetical protein